MFRFRELILVRTLAEYKPLEAAVQDVVLQPLEVKASHPICLTVKPFFPELSAVNSSGADCV
jgi:hypothetical protein